MKYVIFGGGAIGSVLASYMTMGNKDVTLITRGEHLEVIRENGYLDLHYAPDDVHHQVDVQAVTEEEYVGSPDVVILCVKGYGLDEAYRFLDRVCREDTIILTLLNALDIGADIEAGMTQPAVIAQGEAYVASERVKPGYCKHKMDFFRIVFGPRHGHPALPEAAQMIVQDLHDSGCTAEIDNNMLQAALKKFCRVSASSGAMVYFDTNLGGVMDNPAATAFQVQLIKELVAIADAAGVPFDEQWAIDDALEISIAAGPDYKTSFIYDYEAGRTAENQTMFYDVYEMGTSYGLPMEAYGKVCQKLGYVGHPMHSAMPHN